MTKTKKPASATTDRISAVCVLAAFNLPLLPELLARDPSIQIVLSGSKPVDYYVRRCYPALRVIRVASQRCRLPLNLLIGWWAARRLRRRVVPHRVYLPTQYYCAGVITTIKQLGITDLVVNRYEDPDDHFREQHSATLPRRLALRFMRRILKLPVTYYSWGPNASSGNIVGLTFPFMAHTEAYSLARQDCDFGRLERIDICVSPGPQLVWMLSGWEHDLVTDFPSVFAQVNRVFLRYGFSLVMKQHPSFRLPRGARIPGMKRIPRYIPGDLIRFPRSTVIIGMFSTAITTYEELPSISIANLCRPKKKDLFCVLVDQLKRLTSSVEFVTSFEELRQTAATLTTEESSRG